MNLEVAAITTGVYDVFVCRGVDLLRGLDGVLIGDTLGTEIQVRGSEARVRGRSGALRLELLHLAFDVLAGSNVVPVRWV